MGYPGYRLATGIMVDISEGIEIIFAATILVDEDTIFGTTPTRIATTNRDGSTVIIATITIIDRAILIDIADGK